MSSPRFLVVRGGAIGDFIMTLPAIGALREYWPTAHIEIMGYPHITELAHRRYYANGTRSMEARALTGFFVPEGILDPALVDYFAGFTVVLSYLYDPDRVFAANVSRCGVKQLIEGSPKPTTLPAAAHYCQPLEAMALYVKDPRPRLYPSEVDRAEAASYLQRWQGKQLVALHPGSGSPKKNWPVAKFAALIRWLAKQPDTQVLVIGGEADEATLRGLGQAVDAPMFNPVKGLRLVQLAAVVERCAVYVGNDSGITHLAAAVGTPTVALFGPASVSIWEPRGDHVRVVPFGGSDEAEVRREVENRLGRPAR